MTQALIRKAFANLRSHRLQTVVLFVILALATALLALAVAVQRAAANPWQRTFDQTQGAHIWFSATSQAALGSTSNIDGVIATAGPYRVVINTPESQTVLNGVQEPIVLLARPADLEAQIAQVVMIEGRWLAAEGIREVVFDRTLAETMGVTVGDVVTLQRGSRELAATVVGLVYNPAFIPCPRFNTEGMCQLGIGTVYLLPEALNELEPGEGSEVWIQGVRLADPEVVVYVNTTVQNNRPAGVEIGAITWDYLRDRQIEDIQINQVILTVFSVFALGLAGFILVNVASGQILGEYREIALLKSIGFRPREITLLYLITQIILGAVAALVGIALALPLIPSVVGRASEVLNATDTNLITPLLLVAVAAGAVLLVALFTLLPAWQAGRTNTAQAITIGYAPPQQGRPSLPVRLAIALHLPPVVILGVKDAFARPLRAALTITVIAVGVIALTFTLSIEATVQKAMTDPSLFGNFPVDIMAQVYGAPIGDETNSDSTAALNEKTRAILTSNPAVASFISHGVLRAVDEETGDVYLVRALGDDLGLVFPAREGRGLAADGEAMVSQSVATEKGIGIGDELVLLVGSKPVVLHIVGVYTAGPGNEPTVLTTIETMTNAGVPVTVDAYGVEVASEATSREAVVALVEELAQAAGPRVEVYPVIDSVTQGVIAIRSLIYLLSLVLLAIVAANVLATTLLTVRERFRDLATMKMLGMTPRQVARSVTAGSMALSLVAVMVGIPLGLAVTFWLLAIISRQVGLDQGIARLPELPWLAIIVPITLLVVAVGAALPARRAGRLPIADAFRME
jgi:putative ABC transport system permease protein